MTELLHAIPAWLELISLTFCIGTLVCRLWVLDDPAAALPTDGKIPPRLWRLFRIGIAAIIACTIADLFISAAEMSGSAVPTVPLLLTIILKTHFGIVWLIRIAVLLLLLVTEKAGRGYRESRGILFFMLALGFLIAITLSASGHASDKGDFSVPEVLDVSHLLAASIWGGGLFTLSVVILPTLSEETDGVVLARVAARFSRIAIFGVGIIALTSLYNVWTYVGDFNSILKTAYGRTVLVKIILFLVLILFGAFNRYISVPLLQELAGPSSKSPGISNRLIKLILRVRRNQDKQRVAWRFLRNVRIEAVIMLAVLLCAALLRHEVPARHAIHLEHAHNSDHPDHEAHMHYAPHPESVAVRLLSSPSIITAGLPVSITVCLEDRKGRPLQGLMAHHERILHAVIIGRDLNVFAHIHPEDLGTITSKMLDAASFPLRYTFPKAGVYIVGIDFATEDGVYSKTAQLAVSGRPLMGEAIIDFSKTKNFGPYRVVLTAPSEGIKAGGETTLKFLIEKNGEPVTDLEPYLGAAMHIAVVRSDLMQFVHAHGIVPGGLQAPVGHEHVTLPEKIGPEIESTVVFPAKGIYKIFSQVQRHGKILLFDFIVKVQ